MLGRRLPEWAAVAALVLVSCASSTPRSVPTRKPAPTPVHAINVALNLSVAGVWEAGPEPGGCHGTGPYDDLEIGIPVVVSAAGRRLASGTVTRTKNLIAGCALVATIDAVPAAKSYVFQFGNYQAHEVPYASVAKNWNVVVTP